MPWYRWQGDDLILQIRVQPRASRDEICAPRGEELKIRLTAPPLDGQANRKLLHFLAQVCGVAKSRVQLLSGECSRSKRVCIERPARLPAGVEKPEM